jgi:hypothetical protein
MPRARPDFYGDLKPFDDFAFVVDEGQYRPLPAGWHVGIADVVSSTQAVQAGRYKAVNMAGAAAISAITNALGHKPFPVVFGGDGARFAVSGEDAELVRDTLAKTMRWAQELLGLDLRAALVPVETIRETGHDVRVARFAASPAVAYANFSGSGMTWAEAQAKAGRFAIPMAAPGEAPDLSGLACQWGPLTARRGLILSLIVRPGEQADARAFAALVRELVATFRRHNAGSPVPESGPDVSWSRGAWALQSGTTAWKTRSALMRRLRALTFLSIGWVLFKTNLKFGGFDPGHYRRQLALNTDFRKYDDALMMTVDCSQACAEEIERALARAKAAGTALYGLHRQASALITCVVPSILSDDHLHFLDGGEGGYTRAAAGLKGV